MFFREKFVVVVVVVIVAAAVVVVVVVVVQSSPLDVVAGLQRPVNQRNRPRPGIVVEI